MSFQVVFSVVMLFFVLVGIHEFGHFIFAKRAGILVREFAIGFGPLIYSWRRNETTYTLRLLPIGGFVRMAGEEPERNQLEVGMHSRLTITDDHVIRIEPLQDENETTSYVLSPNQKIGTIDSFDLEEKLWIRLTSSNDLTVSEYQVSPQAMIGKPGTWWQIAPNNRLFNNKSIWQRFLTIFAGPLMNGILAFVLFMLFVFLSGMPTESAHIKIGDIDPGTQAELAGLQKGDEVLTINGVSPGDDWVKLSDWIGASADKPMNWIVDRNGEKIALVITPKMREYNGQKRIMVGVRPHRRNATLGESIQGGWLMMSFFTENILEGFKKLFTGNVKLDELGGPVKTVNVTAQFAAKGFDSLVYWAGILSLYLGLFNLLPIPALDGSRIVFLFIEAIRGRPVPPNRESMVHLIGFAMMMAFMVVITFNDISMLFR